MTTKTPVNVRVYGVCMDWGLGFTVSQNVRNLKMLKIAMHEPQALAPWSPAFNTFTKW